LKGNSLADQIGRLNYLITADQSQFSVGMAKAGADVEAFAQKTRAASVASGSAFDNMAKTASQGFAGIQASGLIGNLTQVEGVVGSIGSAFTSTGGIAVGVIAAIVLGLKKIAQESENATKAINNIKKTADIIGETPFNTQVLQRVLERGGIDKPEEVQALILKFSDRIGDLRANGGRGATGDALRRIGLDPTAISNANPESAFEEIVNALGNVRNAYDRASISQAFFGKQFDQVADVVRRGRGGFDEARRFVRNSGPDPDTIAAAAESQRFSRINEQNSSEMWGAWEKRWNEILVGIRLARQRAKSEWSEFGRDLGEAVRFYLNGTPIPTRTALAPPSSSIPSEFRFDAVAEARRNAITAATGDAEKLATQWQATAEHAGMTARQADLQRLSQSGISAALLSQLRSLDSQLSIIERRNAAEAALKGLIESNRTSLEKFYSVIANINLASLTAFDQTRALAGSFRDLERSLGGGSATDLTLTGTNVGSMEAFRTLTNRDNGNQTLQGRILDVLQSAREIQERTLHENEEIARILRDQPGLGVAPIARR
jgi:hypothetical protein